MELKVPVVVDKEYIRNAFEEIKRDYVPRSVIDDIRAEIEKEKNDYKDIGEDFSDNTAYGLELALDIIDKHLRGEEKEK